MIDAITKSERAREAYHSNPELRQRKIEYQRRKYIETKEQRQRRKEELKEMVNSPVYCKYCVRYHTCLIQELCGFEFKHFQRKP